MAEVLAATTVLDTFAAFASNVQKLGEDYYEATAEWKDFPRRVENLRRQGNVWLAAYTKYGISDKALIDALEDASSLLEAEEEKLSNREKSKGTIYARLAGCCARTHAVAFPSAIGVTIQRIEAAFANVQNLLKLKEEVAVGVERELLNRPYSLMFKQDERYVPLDRTEKHIYSALKESMVVLLYGEPGGGKSCLARNVALHYNNVTKDNPKVTDGILFDQVIFLECGQKAETAALPQKLLQHLGLHKLSSIKDEQGTPDILQLLIVALRSRKVLIIFDDVQDDIFLQVMIDVCGDNVKCLVTSQMGDLCSRLNCPSLQKVRIQDILQDVGRKILAAHVGFPNKSIENNQIKDIADKMIKDTAGNPLALASVVSAIKEKEKGSPEAWEEAHNDLQELLRTEDLARMFGQQYGPRSFWSATKLSIKALTKQAQSLLILVHLCKGPSVIEEVIRFLVRRTNLLGGGATFQTLVKELDGRELVKINHSLIVTNDHPEKSWSTHSLQKIFMDQDEEMREKKREMFECTMDPKPSTKFEISTDSCVQDEDAMVARVLSALYFDDELAEKARLRLSIVNDKLNVQRRQAFEPITRLLGKASTDCWTTAAQTAAKQVFVKYFCKSELDDENISILLNMTAYPLAQLATLDAIADIHIIEKASLLNEDSKTLTDLVTFLQNSAAPKLQIKAASALGELIFAGKTNNRPPILVAERVLAAFVTILDKERDPTLQIIAASYFAKLTSQGESAKLQILNQAGALAGLVSSLSRDHSPGLQESAARALKNLAAGGPSFKRTILEEEGALEWLVQSISIDDNPGLQNQAAGALVSLANGRESAKMQILNQEGALVGLVRFLSKDDDPDLQNQAAGALVSLANGGESAKMQILNQEGALVGLVRCLSKDDNPTLQLYAAWALEDLAKGPQSSKLKILKEEGALMELVKSVSKHDKPVLQAHARRAVTSLVGGGEKIRLQLLEESPALAGLVNSVFEEYKRVLQTHAILAVTSLVAGGKEIWLQLLEESPALAGLVYSVFEEYKRVQQIYAIVAVTGLVAREEEIRFQLLEESPVLAGHVNSFFEEYKRVRQTHAIRGVITSLVARGEEIRFQLLEESPILAGDVNSIFEDYNSHLPNRAVATL